MSSKSSTNRGALIVGYTTRRHLIIDLDHTSFEHARRLTLQIMDNWNKVGDCLIMLSSRGPRRDEIVYNRWGEPRAPNRGDNYHLIFDNQIGYNLATKICSVLGHLGVLERDYIKIREFRGDMTTRVSESIFHNEIKPVPRVKRFITNPYTKKVDGMINEYLNLLWFGRALSSYYLDSQDRAYYGRDDPDNPAKVDSVYPVDDSAIL